MNDMWLPISTVACSVLCERWFQLKVLDCLDNNADINIVRGHISHENFELVGYNHERFVKSDELRIYGRVDAVTKDGSYILERKISKKSNESNYIQLCLQAMCLEEELGIHIQNGVLQLLGSRQREMIIIDSVLRDKAIYAVNRCRELLSLNLLPVCKHTICSGCMLRDHCFNVSDNGFIYWQNILNEEINYVKSK